VSSVHVLKSRQDDSVACRVGARAGWPATNIGREGLLVSLGVNPYT